MLRVLELNPISLHALTLHGVFTIAILKLNALNWSVVKIKDIKILFINTTMEQELLVWEWEKPIDRYADKILSMPMLKYFAEANMEIPKSWEFKEENNVVTMIFSLKDLPVQDQKHL